LIVCLANRKKLEIDDIFEAHLMGFMAVSTGLSRDCQRDEVEAKRANSFDFDVC